ncbi:MAG: ribosome silencing factor [Alphaproteobacteria bacterium]|nr:ribosome silencing factor [Alphaproteobacteria bacterium]
MAKTKKTKSKANVKKKSAAVKKPVKKTAFKKPIARKAVKKPSPAPARKKGPRGLPEILRDTALKILDDRQAEDIVTVDLTARSSLADYLIVASGRASRQVAAIAHYLREAFTKHGVRQIRIEGLPQGNWVLVDAGDVVVHLFRPEVRRYYDLEGIWGGDGVIDRAAIMKE